MAHGWRVCVLAYICPSSCKCTFVYVDMYIHTYAYVCHLSRYAHIQKYELVFLQLREVDRHYHIHRGRQER